MHQQLLISVTLQLWALLQPLRPRLLNYRRARPRRSFVQRPNGIEVDVLVQRVLDGGGYVVAVVVPAVAVRVVVTVLIVLIVAVMRHCERVAWIGDLVMELSVVANKVGVGWRGYDSLSALWISTSRGCDNRARNQEQVIMMRKLEPENKDGTPRI